MALQGFRLSPDQSDNDFVTVLADDGRKRIVARITREAIEDRFGLRDESDQHRVDLVRRNLLPISNVIAQKHGRGESTTHVDRVGIADENNRLIVVGYDDLRSLALDGAPS